MSPLTAVLLGLLEGFTEFLPVSSTAHVSVVEKLFGYSIDQADVTAYTAIIQVGALLASLLYFIKDIFRITVGFFRGLFTSAGRQRPEWRLAWAILLGSIPIMVIGFALQGVVSGALRSLWFVVIGLLLFSGAMIAAEWYHKQLTMEPHGRHGPDEGGIRREDEIKIVDGLVVGALQVLALVPGVSRAGATITAGLLRGLDRLTAVRLSFFLGMPALAGSALWNAVRHGADLTTKQPGSEMDPIGWPMTLLSAGVAFVVAYATIAWVLRLVSRRPITVFVPYRIVLAVFIAAALLLGLPAV